MSKLMRTKAPNNAIPIDNIFSRALYRSGMILTFSTIVFLAILI